MTLPAGTLFSKYRAVDFGELEILEGATGINDFYASAIAGAIKNSSSEEYRDTLLRAEKTGESLGMDFDYSGRDGTFEEDQLFAVWEAADIRALLTKLERSLKVTAGRETAPPVDLDRLVRLFPTPWGRTVTAQEVPLPRLTATIFAADSTRICETKGEHAADLAQMIVTAVNNYLPNGTAQTPPNA
jgi:hypothetical protein